MNEQTRRGIQHAEEDAKSIASALDFAHRFALAAMSETLLDGDRDLANFEVSLVRFQQRFQPLLQSLLDTTLEFNLRLRAESDEEYRRAYEETYKREAREVALATLRTFRRA